MILWRPALPRPPPGQQHGFSALPNESGFGGEFRELRLGSALHPPSTGRGKTA